MWLLVTLAVLAVAAAVAVVLARRAWPRWRAIAVESVVDPVRSWLSPPQQVPLATLQRRWLARALRLVTVTVSGRAALPGELVFAVAPADLDRLGDVRQLVEDDCAEAMRRKARRHDWHVPDGFRVRLEADDDVVEGRPVARLGRRPVTVRAVPAPSTRTDVSRTLVLPDAPARTAADALGGSPAASPPDDPARTAAHVWCELIALDDGDDVALGAGRAGPLVVGRDAGCDVTLASPVVSSVHAELASRGGQWVVADRSSLNGTWVNGARVVEAALVHNDEVSFGLHGPRFVFSRLSRDLPAVR